MEYCKKKSRRRLEENKILRAKRATLLAGGITISRRRQQYVQRLIEHRYARFAHLLGQPRKPF